MHAGARQLLRKQSSQSCIRLLESLLWSPSGNSFHTVAKPLLSEAGYNSSTAGYFSSAGPSLTFPRERSLTTTSKSLDALEGSWLQPQYRPPSWSSTSNRHEGGKDQSNQSRVTPLQPVELAAASFQIEQPDVLRDSGDVAKPQEGGNILSTPGADGGRAYATVRAATRSFVPVNNDIVNSSAPWGDSLESALRSANNQLPEFDFPAKAYYIGSKIDVEALRNRARSEQFPCQLQKKDSTIMCVRPGLEISEVEEVTGLPMETYMMAFTYGSVVIFNASDAMTKRLLRMCRKYSKQVVQDEFVEEMMIRVRPDMDVWSKHSPEHIRLQRLDWSNIRVIAAVLGQSVALDFYARSVENMLELFCDMNLEMQRTGNFSTSVGKEQLLKLVAQNNIILTDIITKLGLLDYYDVAWKTSQYGRIWEYLRKDFDVEARFDTIEDKLKLVQENLKYFLELMQHKKSDTLEWTIIILIAAEICVTLYDMFLKVH